MIKITSNYDCCGCAACSQICPKKCIDMQYDKEGFLYPLVDVTKCINCGLCEKACPIINKPQSNNSSTAFAVQNLDDSIRSQSSSGGMFTLLAEYVIENGGIVFGAAMNQNMQVTHTGIDNLNDLAKLRGSKYVQSRIENSYTLAQHWLKQKRLVLFTGTPCQINGLLSFLKQPYDNLLTQDIICHGVPSPYVWNKYIEFLEKQTGSKIKNVSFRNKQNGWKSYSLEFSFYNGESLTHPASQDLYMKTFLSNLSLRPSCFKCNFKDVDRVSDFTLADFWGVEKVKPSMNDNKGTSLVFVNTPKGEKIFSLLHSNMHFEKVDKSDAIKYNLSITKSAIQPKNRQAFITRVLCEPYNIVAADTLPKQSVIKKTLKYFKFKLKSLLKK